VADVVEIPNKAYLKTLAAIVTSRQTINSLMDAVPAGIDFIQVKNDLLAIPTVASVNDLHIWQTGADPKLLSAHLKSGVNSRLPGDSGTQVWD
jgi:Co/Zn/Cd efflux system component